jgi:hypothetical protein
MPLNGLPANFLGATLGALIGALITFVLLKGQTAVVEKKDKDIKILERKIAVFQKYIEAVWDVWEDQEITLEKFQKLTSQYYQNLMIYLKDEKRRIDIGDALTAMGGKIGKKSFADTNELRKRLVEIINTLSAELDLGGEIKTAIMEEHDKIVFPLVFKNELLSKLNDVLHTNESASNFKGGRYEFIWENRNYEFITFELTKFAGIKLAIGYIGEPQVPELKVIFMADQKFTQLNDFRNTMHRNTQRNRFGPELSLSKLIPDDEDKASLQKVIDFSKEDSMKYVREEKRNFPDILAKCVQRYLEQWKLEECDIFKFLEDHIGQGDAK